MLSFNLTFEQIGQRVDSFIKDELEIQGHNASGKLSDSVRHEVNGNSIDGYAESYGIFVNNRSRPHGFNREGIEQLKAWMRVRGIDSDALWPIIKAIQKQGTPTSGSYRFSRNGKRTDFVSDVINGKRHIITDDVNERLAEVFGKEIKDILGNQKILK